MKSLVTAIAHRGDPVHERENTVAAFEHAVLAGADMVELDLRRTSDGEIVVLHDATLVRLWGVDRAVRELAAADVARIGDVSLAIPTLRDVLESIEVPLIIDFTEEEVVDEALAIVRRAAAMDRSLFVTGNVGALRRLRSLAPEARIGLTWAGSRSLPRSLLEELGAEFWNPAFELVSREKVDEAHSMGVRVSTWTVDDPAEMVAMRDSGVDAIVSNEIALLREVLSR
jgi:myo-inositol-1(or 4)-monophosphatase/deoxyribonuclease-2